MNRRIGHLVPKRLKQVLRPLYSRALRYQQPSWLQAIANTKAKELNVLLRETISAQRLPERKTVLFWSMIPWPTGCLNYLLAAALRLRGHRVAAIICDGAPICELKRKAHDRPDCESCFRSAVQYAKAFGVPCYPLSHFLRNLGSESCRQGLVDLDTKQLQECTFEGVPLGKYATYSVTAYFRHLPDVIEGEALSVLEDYVHTGIINCIASKRIIQALKPDSVVTCGGKSPIWAPIFEAAKAKGLRAINWEDPHVFPRSFVFSDRQPALHYNVGEYWEQRKAVPLNKEEQGKVRDLMRRFREGGRYLNNSAIAGTEVKNLIGLRADAPLITLFTNVTWDGTIYGVESAFSSMLDWISSVIEFGIQHSELDVVVRAHPAESRLPAELVPVKVCDLVRQHFPDLPSNIHMVEGDQVNSYDLGLISDVAMVYVTTLGLELSQQGKRPWVAANAHYGRKGFTLDLESKEHMLKLLAERQFQNTLTKQEVELAERYAYLLYFRHFVDMPFFGGHDNSHWTIPSFRELLPSGNPTISDLCDCITGERQFLDIGAR